MDDHINESKTLLDWLFKGESPVTPHIVADFEAASMPRPPEPINSRVLSSEVATLEAERDQYREAAKSWYEYAMQLEVQNELLKREKLAESNAADHWMRRATTLESGLHNAGAVILEAVRKTDHPYKPFRIKTQQDDDGAPIPDGIKPRVEDRA